MPKTILVAEDSETIRRFISMSLKLAGFEVITAVDGMDALEKFPQYQIDLLVTDLNMPNVDGFALIKTIRENPQYKELPIIILSSLGKEEDIKKGFEAGANSYLIKPFNAKRIQYEISKYLGTASD
ncbi:response regulator [Bacteroidetes/Chlorobi group bacterium MS-B_bin-24]|jgi:two-component system chemotaxis response regulator CheY|nr:MAG: response regulator [Bacteroidetes/Chlorobi group bacterium MS-B_bin-24]